MPIVEEFQAVSLKEACRSKSQNWEHNKGVLWKRLKRVAKKNGLLYGRYVIEIVRGATVYDKKRMVKCTQKLTRENKMTYILWDLDGNQVRWTAKELIREVMRRRGDHIDEALQMFADGVQFSKIKKAAGIGKETLTKLSTPNDEYCRALNIHNASNRRKIKKRGEKILPD